MTTRPNESLWQELVLEKETSHEGETWVYQLPDERFGIIAPLQGSCLIDGRDGHGRRSVTLVPGEISRIAPNNPVRLSRRPPGGLPFRVACIQLPLATLQRRLDEHPAAPFSDVSVMHTLRVFDPHVASLVPTLLRAWQTGAGESYAAAAAHYLTEYLLHPIRPASSDAGGLGPAQLLTVQTYMEVHMAENVTLDQLAGEARLSRYHFLRRFSAATGKTPMQYLAELRIDAARHLLMVDDDPISRIGRLCGFPSPENFARVFRKHMGCSASEYRRRARHTPFF